MNPKECPDKSGIVDGKKAFCRKWSRWTNCLEVGHCVYESDQGIEGEEDETDLRGA